MDTISTGSQISSQKVDKYFKQKEKIILDDKEEELEKTKEIPTDIIRQQSIDDFIEDFKL